MTQFSEVVRQMQIDRLQCPNPKCRAKNEKGKEAVIKVDVHNEAWCSMCSEEWPVGEPK